jgi:hypothetical protein
VRSIPDEAGNKRARVLVTGLRASAEIRHSSFRTLFQFKSVRSAVGETCGLSLLVLALNERFGPDFSERAAERYAVR